MPKTIADMVELTGKRVLEHLDRDAEIPLVTVAGAQGDVLVVRVDDEEPATQAMPSTVVLVESEVSPNTHSLHPNGPAFWRADDRDEFSDEFFDGLLVGVLTVPAGSEVFLSHEEHGGLLVGEGTFAFRRQGEFGRPVAD
ncbi:MAG TPA: hypothetical protein PK331_04705 [Gordonia sp. (in: high G+C Gram-positive bacteria)]|uniref:hypothetical protein n=1 Tax=unclassified Gordonia (in: high G+C Gram-positive bacteria) TaxID=2657482 RepID=UPI000FA456A4|nr:MULTISPECIES: hypothetical protein [unclassified Gordonia (in: high G+C Gram-positive bacteria)]RUP37405.1 MAG: hypothetical protein EKK60_12620 [Gordonia sp. (in: high G+C Gram-positive bacteria)]HNP56466.1 hypothetical protein [Gordonia sp. (in: high G+C Gram-positive bacteria)]HRC50215.1 hypothetical protein [Gordonia sp. (in: high G+C Gram-positive bacteria)]